MNKLCKRLRKNYYEKNVQKLFNSDPRSWWKHTRVFLNKTNKSSYAQGLANRNCNGNIGVLAEKINEFFQSVSQHLPPLPPPYPKSIHTHVPDHLIISVESTGKKLATIQSHKSPGPDGIPGWILKDLADELAGPLCSIANASLREGVVPHEWKCADIVPIPKVNPPNAIEHDLRPISLTPTASKQIEALICQNIWDQIKDKINPHQFGCMRGVNTIDALVSVLHRCYPTTDKGGELRMMLVDYSKAYDLIDHSILIEKLVNLGVEEALMDWTRAFLAKLTIKFHHGERQMVESHMDHGSDPSCSLRS